MKNTKDENFDNVYSNFILDDKMLNKNKYCRNNLNYFINNNICKYPTKNNSKNDKNYNKYNQRKINNNKNNNNNLKKLSKSKNNKTRNKTEKNELKLIQNYKKKLNTTNTKLNKTKHKSISKSKSKSKTKQNNSNSSTKDDINNFTYHPKLNKRSLLLANKMEPSSIRLNKNKKKISEEELKPKTFYVNLYKHKQNNTPRQISKKKDEIKNKTIYDKMNNLYLRGIEQKKKQQKIIK